jgi:hypothetical protein
LLQYPDHLIKYGGGGQSACICSAFFNFLKNEDDDDITVMCF